MVRIEKVKIDFPKNSLKLLMKLLIRKTPWIFAMDNKSSIEQQEFNLNYWSEQLIEGKQKDKGFAHLSFCKHNKIKGSEVLNTYNLIIFEAIKEKSKILKSDDISRFYWNFYSPNSTSTFHVDHEDAQKTSIVFNPHSNSGGTEFVIDGKTQFIQSVQNEAIVFQSNILHRGVAPKTETSRFSLNIVVD